MPEVLKGHTFKVCERLQGFCQRCLEIGSTDCTDHGGLSSGESTVLGKRPGDSCVEDLFSASHRNESKTKKGSTKPLSKRKIGAPTNRGPTSPQLGNTLAGDQSWGQASPDEGDKDDEEPDIQISGVRLRENLGKYVVEYRPPRFKWKLWMGTYETLQEGARAHDCAVFYAGQGKGSLHFPDSLALFSALGPLKRPFSKVSKEAKDKAFNKELKDRAKIVIKNNCEVLVAKKAAKQTPARVSACISTQAVPEDVFNDEQASAIHAFDPSPTSSQEGVYTPENLATTDHLQAAEVGSVTSTILDSFTDMGPLPHISTIFPDEYVPGVYIPGFNLIHEPFTESTNIQSFLESMGDDFEDECWSLFYDLNF